MKTRESWWQTRRGEVMKIKQMDDSHVYNAIAYTLGRLIIDTLYGRATAWWDRVGTVKLLVREYNGRMKGKLFQEMRGYEIAVRDVIKKKRRKK